MNDRPQISTSFVLGTPDQDRLARALRTAEDRLGREINLVTMTADEWRTRLKAREGFVKELTTAPKIFLIGDERALRRD